MMDNFDVNLKLKAWAGSLQHDGWGKLLTGKGRVPGAERLKTIRMCKLSPEKELPVRVRVVTNTSIMIVTRIVLCLLSPPRSSEHRA
jgi:hypothetical protein